MTTRKAKTNKAKSVPVKGTTMTVQTPEQVALMATVRDEWLAHGLSTKPLDRAECEHAIRRLYECGGLKPPTRIFPASSPMAGALLDAIFSDPELLKGVAGQNVRDNVWDNVGDNVRDNVGDNVGANVRANVGDNVRANVRDNLQSTFREISRKVDLGRALWGQHEAGLLSFCDYFNRCGHPGLPELTAKTEGLLLLGKAAGWTWAREHAAIVSARPVFLKRDELGRLHSGTGPAIMYPDGWGFFAWRGVRIPAEWILSPKEVDPMLVLTHENAEQRRCLAEILGWTRVLEKLEPTVIDRHADPEVGELLRVDPMPGTNEDPFGQFLRVRCGTGRTFVLRVSPQCKTALEAQGELSGLSPSTMAELEVRT